MPVLLKPPRMILDGCGGFQYGGSFERGDMKILFVASEGLPFSKTGGLADVVEALPKALAALGHEVVVLLPRYRNTKAGGVAAPGLTIPAALVVEAWTVHSSAKTRTAA